MRAGLQGLALAAMSLVFFTSIVAPLTDMVLLGSDGALQDTLFPLLSMIWNNTLPAFIALCGSIVFLAAAKERNPSWYLGIPLALGFAFIAFSPAFFTIFPLRDPSPAYYDPLALAFLLSAYGTFLLPPCVALFFWSQTQPGRLRTVLVVIALIVTLNAFAFLFSFFSAYLVAVGVLAPPSPQFIDGPPVKTDGEGLLFLFIHFTIGLPILGICFLALAVFTRYIACRAVPAPLPYQENHS